MLERLADLIRSKDTKKGFEVTADMLSITGLNFIQLKEILENLGYKSENKFSKDIKTAHSVQNENSAVSVKNQNKDGSQNEQKNNLEKNEISIDQFIFKFEFKKKIITKPKPKVLNKNNQLKNTSKTIIKKNFKIKNNNKGRKLDPNNPFSALASLIHKEKG